MARYISLARRSEAEMLAAARLHAIMATVERRESSMTAARTMDALIEKNTKLRGGRPIIAGTGTTVRTIAGLYKLGLGAEEIATQLPHLNLAQIYAALTYYHLHVDEIEADIEADSEENLKRLAHVNAQR
jgi:uncharacterized protein (DUF433 family)